MSSDHTVPVVQASHSLRPSSRENAKTATTSRHTMFMTSSSQHLSPSPPTTPFTAINRSSSLRSTRSPSMSRDEGRASTATNPYAAEAAQNQTSVATESTKSASIKPPVELPQPTIQTPADSVDNQASLRPKPSPLYPRRRSWFREEDPSAFGPPSPDPLALSPMAAFRSSMSEDEQRDELFSESYSGSSRPPSSSSLSPASAYPSRQPQEPEQGSHSNSATPVDKNLLALPSRTRSASTRSYHSNPAVVINPAHEDADLRRRASDGGGVEVAKTTPPETNIERSSSSASTNLTSGPRSQKRSVWERALRRGGGVEETGTTGTTGSPPRQSKAGL